MHEKFSKLVRTQKDDDRKYFVAHISQKEDPATKVVVKFWVFFMCHVEKYYVLMVSAISQFVEHKLTLKEKFLTSNLALDLVFQLLLHLKKSLLQLTNTVDIR